MVGKVAALVGVLVLLADGSCGGRSPIQQGPANVSCHLDAVSVQANNPHQSKGTPTDIVGKVRATCTGSIDTLNIEAKLQRLDKASGPTCPARSARGR